MEQRTADWHAARVGRVTGSRIGAIMGLSPWSKPHDVLRAMVREYAGAESEFKGNIATDYGTRFEPFALGDFEMETGLIVEQCGLIVHPKHEWLAASPDGLIGDNAVLEIKCPFYMRDAEKQFKSIHEQQHYYAQLQLEMACAGRGMAYFYQWAEGGRSLIEEVTFDPVFFEKMLAMGNAFYMRYLAATADPEPYLDASVNSTEAYDLSMEYQSLKAAADEIKERMEVVKERLVEMAGGKKCQVGSSLVYPSERAGSISYAKAIKALMPDADLEPWRGEPTTVWTIKPC